jgi:hypothetical protein
MAMFLSPCKIFFFYYIFIVRITVMFFVGLAQYPSATFKVRNVASGLYMTADQIEGPITVQSNNETANQIW